MNAPDDDRTLIRTDASPLSPPPVDGQKAAAEGGAERTRMAGTVDGDSTVMAGTAAGDSTVMAGAAGGGVAGALSERSDPVACLPAGSFLEDFELTGVLGEGGFGIVYLALDHTLGRRVAIKEFMPSALAARTERGMVQIKSERHRETFDLALRSFVNEARLLASFDHPALLKVHRFWEANGTAYMAMPFVEGKTLKDTLRELGAPPDEAWLRQVLRPLTEALQVMHDARCFHRDIAPDNVMLLAGSGRPLLLDFGAARQVIGDATQALTVILKTGYAPVEQYAESPGMKQGPWTDVYALGALLHFAIMGCTPPSAVGRLLADDYVPLTQAAAGRYSHDFLAAIDRALAVRPQERTPSINLLRLELDLDGAGTPRPQPATPAPAPNNLPQQATRFLGREPEVREVRELLSTTRLVTLLGMGGLGKTRLSLQVGQAMLPAFSDGVWFLDLSGLRDPAFVPDLAAGVFGLREEPGRPLLQTLAAHLSGRKLLLILDNCEHLMAPAIDLAQALLAAAPGLRLLASSREALRLPGEQVYAVHPLPLPPVGADLRGALDASAVQLFVERAQEQKRGFTLTERDAPAVVELVRRLEGIPLAIELAAARVRALSVADINARLKDRYKLLNRGSDSVHARQQTLRALVDWSYELLSAPEQALFHRLGVFVGGFDLAAAEGVCAAEPLSGDDVLDLLSALVDKSLVMMEERAGAARYRMLETLRDYARDKLLASPEASGLAAAHGHYYFARAKDLREALKGEDQGLWMQRGEQDLDNLRAAIALAQSGGIDPIITVKMAVALQGFWVLRGNVSEGRAIVREALRLPQVQAFAVARAHALYVDAALALAQGEHADALLQLQQCLALRREGGNPAEIAATLSTLAKVQLHASAAGWHTPPAGQAERRRWPRGQVQAARDSATEALALLRQVGDPVNEAIALQDLGQIELFEGQLDAAQALFAQSLDLARQTRHQEVEAECERLLGAIALERGQFELAQQHLGRSRQMCVAAQDSRGAACAQLGLGRLAAGLGQQDVAQAQLAAAVRTFQAADMLPQWLEGLTELAALALQRGRPADAARVLVGVQARLQSAQIARSAREARRCDALLQQALDALQPSQAARIRTQAEGWDLAATTGAALAA